MKQSPPASGLKRLSLYGSLLQSRVKAVLSSGMAEEKTAVAPELHALVDAVADACLALQAILASDEQTLRQGVISGERLEELCDALDCALFFGLRPPATPAAIIQVRQAYPRRPNCNYHASEMRNDDECGGGLNCALSDTCGETWCEYQMPHFRLALVDAVSMATTKGVLHQCLQDSDSCAFVRTAHGICRAWHRCALRQGCLLEALQELFASPKLDDFWYTRSIVAQGHPGSYCSTLRCVYGAAA